MKLSWAIPFVLFLVGCGTFTQPINEADKALERRVEQISTELSSVKSETIAESKAAAVELIGHVSTELKGAGKEVIATAASEFDSRVEKRLEQVDVIVSKAIDKTGDKIESVLTKQQKDATDSVRILMRDEVPAMVESAVVRAADKVAERLGVTKETVPGPDGVPVEVWTLAGSGLLGWIVNTVRTWRNSKTGAKRWRDEDIDHRVDELLARRLEELERNGRSNSRSNPNPPDDHRDPPAKSFTYTS